MATTIRLRHTPADHGRRLTLKGFIEAEYEEGYRYELTRGVVEVTQIPDERHGLIACFLYDAISAYRREHPGVIQRYGGGGEFRLFLSGMISGRDPDVAVVLQGTPKDPFGHRPPALVMEVVSQGSKARRRGYVTKREEYHAYEVHEYWIIDPFTRSVVVLIRDGDGGVKRTFQGDQTSEGLVLPGFAVRLPELWATMADVEDGDEAEDRHEPAPAP